MLSRSWMRDRRGASLCGMFGHASAPDVILVDMIVREKVSRRFQTCAFRLARAAEALGEEAEVKSPWYLCHGDARGDCIMQVFETKEAAIDAACALVGKGAYVFEVGAIQEGQGGTRLNGAEIRGIFDERARITE